MIGMARKSGNKLQYAFKTHDEFRSYFYLNLLLFQDDNELEREPVTDYFENIGYIHHILNQKNIVLNYCGSFGAVSRANVKKLFRLQKQTPEVILQLTEITELLTLNIEQHAAQADAHSSPALGILIISMFPDHYKITTGNYINQCSTKQLEIELGNKRIADNGNATSFQSDPAHELSGLEKALLISNTAVVWEIQSVNDTLSFLSLQYTLHFDLPTTPPDQATATID